MRVGGKLAIDATKPATWARRRTGKVHQGETHGKRRSVACQTDRAGTRSEIAFPGLGLRSFHKDVAVGIIDKNRSLEEGQGRTGTHAFLH